jgi:hypothetical protein
MISHNNGFFYSLQWRKKMILQIRKPISGFFPIHMGKKGMILHNCRFISGFLKFTYVKKKIDIAHLQAYKWSFTFTHEKKKMILHLWGAINELFYSHRWIKKWHYTLASLQMVFFTFTHEKKRNEIAHLGDHKWYINICEKRKWLVNKKKKKLKGQKK